MTINRQNRSTKTATRIRHLVGFTTLVMLVFCTIVAYQGSQGYQMALKQGESNADRLTHILSDHVELTFLGTDLALRRAIERQYMNSLFGNNLTDYMEQNFRVWIDETPQIVAMAIVSSTGEIKVAAHKKGYEDWLDYHQGVTDKQLLETMKNADDRYVFLGRLATRRGRQLIIMSRRYTQLSGEFGGLVIAALDPGYFVRFYSSVALGTQKYMSLTLADGTVLASGPTESVGDDMIVQNVSRTFKRPGNTDITQTATMSINDTIKVTASKYLKNIPILVHVVLDENDVVAAWRQSRTKDISFLALFTVFGSVLSFFAVAMARQIVRAEESEEAAILASQAKSEFLANMSHELRTPLNAIIGFSEMMNSGYFGPLTPKQRERIHDITLCGSHLLQLISDILEFSKGDAGKLELLEEKVDLGEIVNDCGRMMDGRMKTKRITCETLVPEHFPALWGDKRKVRQILLNLLSNATKFTPEHGVIKIICEMDAEEKINLIVSDNGIGIQEADIPKALSVFGQVRSQGSHEGTGLGLPLCKMYAELHGGRLALTSKLNEGTTVRITFPPERTLGKSS